MKQTISLALVMMLAISSAFATDKTTASKHEIVKGDNISVSYGRPARKGKVAFASTVNEKAIVAYGQIWRVGDNEGTEITVDKDCVFGGFPLKAGTYTLFIKNLGREWMIYLNSQLGQKGVFNFDKVKDKDVIYTATSAKKVDKAVEKLTITLQDGGMLIAWGNTEALIKVKFNGQ